MAGLLANFGRWTGDPDRDSAINQGLLGAAMSLMQGRGTLGQSIGGAGLQGIGMFQQAMQDAQGRRLRELQMRSLEEQMRAQSASRTRQETLQALPRQFQRSTNPAEILAGGEPNKAGMDATGLSAAYAREGDMERARHALALGEQPKRNLISVAPGASLVDEATGQSVFTAPAKQSDDEFTQALRDAGIDPASPRGRQLALQRLTKLSTHQPGTSVTYGAPMAGVDQTGAPVFFQPDKRGGAPSIVPGVRPPKDTKPLTEAQAKAATFGAQMESAERELANTPLDQNKLWSQVETGLAGGATNVLTSAPAQRARQSQEQWTEAYLRFKTGAAATEGEVSRNVRTFFPRPGDTPEVVAQKARARRQAAQDVGIAATGTQGNNEGWAIRQK